MTRHIAFLRAINVGGRNVKMETLRALFETLGLAEVESFIASGNVIFRTSSTNRPSLEQKIKSALHTALGYEVSTFVRTDTELAEVAQYQPFSHALFKTAGAFNVGFLAEPLGREEEKEIANFATAIDGFHLNGRELYWLCQKKQSESTFTNVAFERALGVRATFRGMNTIQKLAAKYPALDRSARKRR